MTGTGVLRSFEASVGRALEHPVDVQRAHAVFGTAAKSEIASVVYAFCVEELRVEPRAIAWTALGVGVAIAVELAHSPAVVVKFARADVDLEAFQAARRAQAWLFARGYPCPELVREPAPFRGTLASAERLVEDGEYRDARLREVRQAMAQALAEHVTRMEGFGERSALPPFPERVPAGAIWNRHSPEVELGVEGPFASELDRLGRVSLGRMLEPASKPSACHFDWTAEHLRFAGEHVAVVYDWDSMRFGEEAAIVGRSACHFTYSRPLGIEEPPSVDAMLAFVADYERARGRAFTRAQRTVLSASATYLVAYIARAQLGGGRPDGAHARLIEACSGDLLIPV